MVKLDLQDIKGGGIVKLDLQDIERRELEDARKIAK